MSMRAPQASSCHGRGFRDWPLPAIRETGEVNRGGTRAVACRKKKRPCTVRRPSEPGRPLTRCMKTALVSKQSMTSYRLMRGETGRDLYRAACTYTYRMDISRVLVITDWEISRLSGGLRSKAFAIQTCSRSPRATRSRTAPEARPGYNAKRLRSYKETL
jgi:hypothetical protein